MFSLLPAKSLEREFQTRKVHCALVERVNLSKNSKRGGRRGGCLAKLGGEQNSGGTIFLFHFASRGLTFTIGWVYDDEV